MRIVHPNLNDFDFFEEAVAIVINFAKTFTSGLWADLHDLSQIEACSLEEAGACPDFASVRPIPWS